jgi:hypothetical protein
MLALGSGEGIPPSDAPAGRGPLGCAAGHLYGSPALSCLGLNSPPLSRHNKGLTHSHLLIECLVGAKGAGDRGAGPGQRARG